MQRYSVLLTGLLLLAATTLVAAGRSIAVTFYSEVIELPCDAVFPHRIDQGVPERYIPAYYEHLQQQSTGELLAALLEAKTRLKLNDWHFYELITVTVAHIYPEDQARERELTSWFLMNRAGFDARITYLEGEIYLNVRTRDKLFDVPIIEIDDQRFANLTQCRMRMQSGRALYMLDVAPNAEGKAFQFTFHQLPDLRADVIACTVDFPFYEEKFSITFQADRNIQSIMQAYPYVAEESYLEVPLSATVRASLLPQLSAMMEGLKLEEKVAFLVSFTRSGFSYQEDHAHFGRNKPMIADEVFHYPHSDCEDRSALFVRLVESLLGLPMIVMAYEDHLTIGVAIPDAIGDSVLYEGKKYLVCDPTGPQGSSQIGYIPKEYRGQDFQIISSFSGQKN